MKIEEALATIKELRLENARLLTDIDLLNEEIDNLKYCLSQYEEDYVPNEDERFEEWKEKYDG